MCAFPPYFVNNFQAEIQLLLDYLFFRFTILTEKIQTPGNTLQNLNFVFNTKSVQKQKFWYMILSVFVPYLMSKAQEKVSRDYWMNLRTRDRSFKDKLKFYLAKLLTLIQSLYKILNLVNLVLFFVTHKFRSLCERMLGITMERIDPNQRRHIDFSYINRIIVWNAIGQSLSQLLPFLDISKLRGMFNVSNKLTSYISLDDKDINSDLWCGICGTTQICMPFRATECKHIFCYYCIKTHLEDAEDDENGAKCPKSNSKSSKHVQFNQLPNLVREWDKNKKDNIQQYHTSILQRSAMMNTSGNSISISGGFKIKTEGNNMIKDYMNNVFDSNGMINEPLIINHSNNNNNNYITDDEIQINSYQAPQKKILTSQSSNLYQVKARTDFDEEITSYQMAGSLDSQVLHHHKQELKQLIKKSNIIAEEENEDDQYKIIYSSSNRESITKYPLGEGGAPTADRLGEYRTESFHQDLEDTEFKKETRLNNKNYKQPSITQRFLNRKDRFMITRQQKDKKNARLTKQQIQHLQKDDLYHIRKQELQQKAQERKQKLEQDNILKMNREQMITNVSQIIFKHIEAAEKYITEPTQAALLFHEFNFVNHEWLVQTINGYSSTMPLFLYVLEPIEYIEKQCAEGDVILFIKKIFEKMQLATECVIIMLIYLEKIMINGEIEIRYCNWKPLIFTSILTASKFWEDINFWNVDYVDGLGIYPLTAINRMESEFLSLCDYNLFVSAELYIQYSVAVREMNNQIYTQQNNPQKTIPFNRFKNSSYQAPQINRLQKLESFNRFDGAYSISPSNKAQLASVQNTENGFLAPPPPKQLPVFYIQKDSQGKANENLGGPHYPALKVNVTAYQKDANDILEESLEEIKKDQINQSIEKQGRSRQPTKIKKILSPLNKQQNQNTNYVVVKEDVADDDFQIVRHNANYSIQNKSYRNTNISEDRSKKQQEDQ